VNAIHGFLDHDVQQHLEKQRKSDVPVGNQPNALEEVKTAKWLQLEDKSYDIIKLVSEVGIPPLEDMVKRLMEIMKKTIDIDENILLQTKLMNLLRILSTYGEDKLAYASREFYKMIYPKEYERVSRNRSHREDMFSVHSKTFNPVYLLYRTKPLSVKTMKNREYLVTQTYWEELTAKERYLFRGPKEYLLRGIRSDIGSGYHPRSEKRIISRTNKGLILNKYNVKAAYHDAIKYGVKNNRLHYLGRLNLKSIVENAAKCNRIDTRSLMYKTLVETYDKNDGAFYGKVGDDGHNFLEDLVGVQTIHRLYLYGLLNTFNFSINQEVVEIPNKEQFLILIHRAITHVITDLIPRQDDEYMVYSVNVYVFYGEKRISVYNGVNGIGLEKITIGDTFLDELIRRGSDEEYPTGMAIRDREGNEVVPEKGKIMVFNETTVPVTSDEKGRKLYGKNRIIDTSLTNQVNKNLQGKQGKQGRILKIYGDGSNIRDLDLTRFEITVLNMKAVIRGGGVIRGGSYMEDDYIERLKSKQGKEKNLAKGEWCEVANYPLRNNNGCFIKILSVCLKEHRHLWNLKGKVPSNYKQLWKLVDEKILKRDTRRDNKGFDIPMASEVCDFFNIKLVVMRPNGKFIFGGENHMAPENKKLVLVFQNNHYYHVTQIHNYSIVESVNKGNIILKLADELNDKLNAGLNDNRKRKRNKGYLNSDLENVTSQVKESVKQCVQEINHIKDVLAKTSDNNVKEQLEVSLEEKYEHYAIVCERNSIIPTHNVILPIYYDVETIHTGLIGGVERAKIYSISYCIGDDDEPRFIIVQDEPDSNVIINIMIHSIEMNLHKYGQKYSTYHGTSNINFTLRFIAYNGSRFDHLFLFLGLLDNDQYKCITGPKPNGKMTNMLMTRKTKIHSVTNGEYVDSQFEVKYGIRCTIWDPLLFIMSSLRQAAIAFKLPINKEELDHEAAQQAYENGRFKEYLDEMRDKIESYNNRDVEVLRMLCVKLHEAIMEGTGLNVFDYSTISGMCYDFWSKLKFKSSLPHLKKYVGKTMREVTPAVKTPQLDKIIRSAMIGGRTEGKVGRNKLFNEMLRMLDVTSLYPFIMAVSSFPIGKETQCHTVEDCLFYMNNYTKTGIYRVWVDARPMKNKTKQPVLPVKTEEGQWDWKNYDKQFLAWVPDVTVKQLIKYGARVYLFQGGKMLYPLHDNDNYDLDAHKLSTTLLNDYLSTLKEGHIFSTSNVGIVWDKSGEGDLYGEYVKIFGRIKKQQDEYKAKDYSRYNPVLRSISKLMLNSLSGKMGQRNYDKASCLVSGVKYDEKLFDEQLEKIQKIGQPNKTININGIDKDLVIPECYVLDQNAIILSYKKKKVFNRRYAKPSQIAVFIYAHSRSYMYDIFFSRFNIYYSDTDSAIISEGDSKILTTETVNTFAPAFEKVFGVKDCPLIFNGEGGKLFGQLEYETMDDKVKEHGVSYDSNCTSFTSVDVIAPKTYCCMRGDELYKYRTKGVRPTDYFYTGPEATIQEIELDHNPDHWENLISAPRQYYDQLIHNASVYARSLQFTFSVKKARTGHKHIIKTLKGLNIITDSPIISIPPLVISSVFSPIISPVSSPIISIPPLVISPVFSPINSPVSSPITSPYYVTN